MLFLSDDDIFLLTNRKRRTAQIIALRMMGIEHKIRPDGSIVISHAHVQKVLDGDSSNMRFCKEIEPDWSFFDAQATQDR